MALLHLAAAEAPGRVCAATVDHGLRSESADEALEVANHCRALGISHDTLIWAWNGRGNLQAAAREARFALIGDWARTRGLAAVCLGHTLDDQAETVLMRLARGSGVDGLSAMAPRLRRGGLTWLRPLLDTRRDVLREILRREQVPWAEDPSNEDIRFGRVKARAALAALEPLGITPEGLADTALRLAGQRAALDHAMAELAGRARRIGVCGSFSLDPKALAAGHPEIAMRLLADTLMKGAGRALRPRSEPLARLHQALTDPGGSTSLGGGATLHGCVLRPYQGEILVLRESADMAPSVPYRPDGTVWDGRFRIMGDPGSATRLGPAAAEGLRALAVAEETGHASPPAWSNAPREARLAAPALWSGEGGLIALPHAAFGPELSVEWLGAAD